MIRHKPFDRIWDARAHHCKVLQSDSLRIPVQPRQLVQTNIDGKQNLCTQNSLQGKPLTVLEGRMIACGRVAFCGRIVVRYEEARSALRSCLLC